ncbi:hypothetical protein [Sphingomonas turrisvirgatae]|uniref:Uncharacterized protein n=1 Tax=Sphingomonas turrisvirgatae TaxID=1888892 RepID=A0A1E3LZW2_9SPHN|nr:hypothetical protein [Sphingomonas turrisvirgatae]ODP39357.1 hypothetical protein BFL28_11150 [Sphingomonas turrisvirgatae]
MLELKVKAGRRMVPIFDLPVALGRADAAREIGDTIDTLIAFMDDLGGDPDLEVTNLEDDFALHLPFGGGQGPGCPISDSSGDVSWTEWDTRGRHKLDEFGSERRAAMPGRYFLNEDDEDDDPDTSVEDDPTGFDPEEDMCLAGDDGVFSGPASQMGLLRVEDGAGSEDDAERWQDTRNVPVDRVVSLEPDPFTGVRVNLGRANLLTSFRTNGEVVASADYSGVTLITTGWVGKIGGNAVIAPTVIANDTAD